MFTIYYISHIEYIISCGHLIVNSVTLIFYLVLLLN